MKIYINDALRSDIKLAAGAEFETTSAHQTSSTIAVSIPTENQPVQEFDYISIQEDDGAVDYAGTVLADYYTQMPMPTK